MESRSSADTEEEALRKRLEELTSNISDPGTSSEDEVKPGGTLHAVSPEVRSCLRSQTKGRAKETVPGSHPPFHGGQLTSYRLWGAGLAKTTQGKRLEANHGNSAERQQPMLCFVDDQCYFLVPRCA